MRNQENVRMYRTTHPVWDSGTVDLIKKTNSLLWYREKSEPVSCPNEWITIFWSPRGLSQKSKHCIWATNTSKVVPDNATWPPWIPVPLGYVYTTTNTTKDTTLFLQTETRSFECRDNVRLNNRTFIPSSFKIWTSQSFQQWTLSLGPEGLMSRMENCETGNMTELCIN